jgi:hypothetical protein
MILYRMALRAAALLALVTAAAGPSRALSLSTVPAQPVEGTPFTLGIGLVADCVGVDGVIVTPGFPGRVTVTLNGSCPLIPPPPRPLLLEVPIGPLPAGRWIVRVEFSGEEELLTVDVAGLPFRIELDPPFPQAGSPFTLRFSGSASCADFSSLGAPAQDGNVLSLPFFPCPILPPPPAPFLIEQELAPLPAGDYVVQVTESPGRAFASHRFHVFGAEECTPSETALCLQDGRFRVEAVWRTATAEGPARVRTETADSGSLWFFSPTNLEMLVKVLNACQTPKPMFWVFAAGLTDVEVELVVTDMTTKQTRRYRNPRGKPFTPILDTSAFDC